MVVWIWYGAHWASLNIILTINPSHVLYHRYLQFPGGSFIAAPDGHLVAFASRESEVVSATLRFEATHAELAARNPYLVDRRPELYKGLIDA